MSTGETLLVVGAVAVFGYLLWRNNQPVPGPVVIQGGARPESATNKYDFYSLITRESGDVARQAISTFGPSQTPPATRTAP